MVKIFWDFLTFYQIFLSPQVNRSAIISNKHVVLKVASWIVERLKIRRKNRKNLKTCWNHNLIPSLPVKMNFFFFFNTSQRLLNLSRRALFQKKTRVYLKHCVNNCSHQVTILTSWSKVYPPHLSEMIYIGYYYYQNFS